MGNRNEELGSLLGWYDPADCMHSREHDDDVIMALDVLNGLGM